MEPCIYTRAHRRFLAIHLSGYEGIDRVQKILGLLVESGAVYCALQVCSTIRYMIVLRLTELSVAHNIGIERLPFSFALHGGQHRSRNFLYNLYGARCKSPNATLSFNVYLITCCLQAMYPTLVMFLAKGEGSFAKNYAPQAEDGLRPISGCHISFALKPLDLENITSLTTIKSLTWTPPSEVHECHHQQIVTI